MRMKLFYKVNPTGSSIKGLEGLKDVGKIIKKGLKPGTGENARDLEEEVNAWLAEHSGIRIAEIRQSATSMTLLISIWYEDAA